MKNRFALLLAATVAVTGLVGRAQDQAPAPAPQPPKPAAAPAQPAEAAQPVDLATQATAEEAGEVVPLITFDDTPLTDVIKTLARQAGINFLFDPRLTAGVTPDGKPIVPPTISIRFENVTALQALEAVLLNHDYALVKDPKTKIARVTLKPSPTQEPLVTKVLQLKYSNPTNLVSIVKPMTSRGQVLPDGRTSQLVVLATENELEEIQALIEKLDTATKQVLIEARLLETSKNPRTIKGIDWTDTFQAQRFSFGNGITSGETTITSPGATTTTTTPSGRQISRTENSSIVQNLATAIGAGGLSIDTTRGFSPHTAFLNADGLRAVLSFLNRDADTEVIATPRTVTLDNQTAILSVTRANPIFKNTAGTQGSPGGSEVTYTNLGTILTVTPRIAADNAISLRVVPEVSRVVDTVRKTVASTVNEADVYAINKIETQVLVPSGNTLVMGGLISDAKTKTYSKVPLLGDIPGLGLAFRREEKRRDKSNLIIFITPTVISDADFQPAADSGFLRTKPPPDKVGLEDEQSWWDSGKPARWRWRKDAAKP
jgi:type II secretory pathway component GspD/PulD (secretin)